MIFPVVFWGIALSPEIAVRQLVHSLLNVKY